MTAVLLGIMVGIDSFLFPVQPVTAVAPSVTSASRAVDTDILYVLTDPNTENIHRVYADGSGEAQLTWLNPLNQDPAWSPDGNRIVYGSAQGGSSQIYRMNADGSGQIALTADSAWNEHPTWSPDGTQIGFSSTREGPFALYRMDVDGSQVQRLTLHPGNDHYPNYSPDGSRICYQNDRSGSNDLYITNADGTNEKLIVGGPSADQGCAWSPDSNQLVFETDRDGTFEVYKVNADGTGLIRLSDHGGGLPSWSAGGRIWFHSDRSGEYKIYSMDPSGNNVVCLTCALPGLHFQPVVRSQPPCPLRLDAIHPKVLIVTYNPMLTSLNKTVFENESDYNPRFTSEQMARDFCQASGGFVGIQIVGQINRNEFPLEDDGGRLTESEYLNLRSQNKDYAQAHNHAMVDVRSLIEENGLNQMVKSHHVDEIWLFGSWTMSLYESYMGGPGSFWINGPSFNTDSGHAFVVMGFENAVGIPNSLHSIGHRVECILDQAYGYYNYSPDTPWARFRKNPRLSVTLFPGLPNGIGDIHDPPNARVDQDYDYYNPAPAISSADDWYHFPNLTGATQQVTAFTWGDTAYGYYQWWYAHLPKGDGVSPRSPSTPTELRQNNWWKYIFNLSQYPELVGTFVDWPYKAYLPAITSK
jgi:hypothetical protein